MVGTVRGTGDCGGPVKEVVADRTGAYARRRVDGQIIEFLVDPAQGHQWFRCSLGRVVVGGCVCVTGLIRVRMQDECISTPSSGFGPIVGFPFHFFSFFRRGRGECLGATCWSNRVNGIVGRAMPFLSF